jgi:hypothetical protein
MQALTCARAAPARSKEMKFRDQGMATTELEAVSVIAENSRLLAST